MHITCLPAFEGFQRHPGVVGDRAVDVDEIDVLVGEHFLVIGVAFVDAELVADLVQLGFVPPADGDHVRIRMALIDRNKLRPEP